MPFSGETVPFPLKSQLSRTTPEEKMKCFTDILSKRRISDRIEVQNFGNFRILWKEFLPAK
jgi:hypothetical protein